MADVIRAALAPSDHGDWRYNWGAVSARISSKMHWHLPGPDAPDADPVTRRGWIPGAGFQIGVMATGLGETVRTLSFEINTWRETGDVHSDLLAALSEVGIEATETRRSPAPDFQHTDTPIIDYRLSTAGRDEGVLTRVVSCTSPRSAAAQRCSATYVLELGED